MSKWGFAQFLRKRATEAPTKAEAVKLYAMARAIEIKTGFRDLPKSEENDNEHAYAPGWFQRMRRQWKCADCGTTARVWCYRTNGKRRKLLRWVRQGMVERTYNIVTMSVQLCRACALKRKAVAGE